MAKKKQAKNSLVQYLPVLAFALGIVAIIMMFLPAVALKDTDTTYTGWQSAFGYTTEVLTKKVAILNFSFPVFLSFILMLAGTALALLQFIAPKNRLFIVISAVCFLVSAIFWFLTPQLLSIGKGATFGGLINASNVKEYLVLAVGSIVGGICSALACVCGVATFVLNNK